MNTGFRRYYPTAYVWDKDGELTSIFTIEEHLYADGAWDLCRRAVEELCPNRE